MPSSDREIFQTIEEGEGTRIIEESRKRLSDPELMTHYFRSTPEIQRFFSRSIGGAVRLFRVVGIEEIPTGKSDLLFRYRLEGEGDSNTQSISIVGKKHLEVIKDHPWLRYRRFLQDRGEASYWALRKFRELIGGLEDVDLPVPLHYDRSWSVLWMSDLGEENRRFLGGGLDPEEDIAIARTLGDALGRVHSATHSRQLSRLHRGRTSRALISYPEAFMAGALTQKSAAQWRSFTREIREEDYVLIHGDLCPKNILITPRGMALLDFERSNYFDPAYDLGFFCAHLVISMLDAPDPRLSLLFQGFLSEYERRILREGVLDLDALNRRAARFLAMTLFYRARTLEFIGVEDRGVSEVLVALGNRILEKGTASPGEAIRLVEADPS
jgi:tRNA A-37 threonylcarbamoyl transferase component Bud32